MTDEHIFEDFDGVLLSMFLVATQSQSFLFACQVYKSLCVWYKELLFWLSKKNKWCLGGSFEYDNCGMSPLR